MLEIVAAVTVGLLAGVIAGFFGVGGGIIFVPTFALVLGLGQLESEATSLAAILPTVVAGAWQQHRYGNVSWLNGLFVGAVGVIGVELGVRAAVSLDEDMLRRLFALLLFGVAAHLALSSLRS